MKLNKNEVLLDEEDKYLLDDFKWSVHRGYAITTTNFGQGYETISMHRMVMKAKLGELIDHINHNRLDNRKSNLRSTTYKVNALNQKNPAIGVRVSRSGRYEARLSDQTIGLFDTYEEAKAARDAKVRELTA